MIFRPILALVILGAGLAATACSPGVPTHAAASAATSTLAGGRQPQRVTPATDTLIVGVGQQELLRGTVTYADGTTDGDIAWATDDAQIATVEATTGRLTAHAAGTTTLRARSTLDPSRFAVVLVSVRAPKDADGPIAVVVEPASLALKVGETARIQATVTQPGGGGPGGVAWSSDDRSIAHVDGSGKVTALKPGKTTVRATSDSDGSTRAAVDVTVS